MKIRYRKTEKTHKDAALFGGHVYVPNAGAARHTPEPVYIVELVYPDGETVVPIARLERENMQGMGINMWGSRHRWTINRNPRAGEKVTHVTGIVVEYHDTMADCKYEIGERIRKAFRAAFTCQESNS
jgi:hypothetical protein